MTEAHLTNEQIQMFVDNALSHTESESVRQHLDGCSRCSAVYRSAAALDDALWHLPQEHLADGFARDILAKLHIATKRSFLFQIVENLGYVFGLMVVLGVMLTVFIVTGVIGSQQLTDAGSTAGAIPSVLFRSMDTGFGSLTATLQSYFPFLFANGNLKLALMGTIIVAMLALLDRILRRKFVQ